MYLLGHSCGALVALGAAALVPAQVSKLILYEPPLPSILGGAMPDRLQTTARDEDWDGFSAFFFENILLVPAEEVRALRESALWAAILADGPATLADLRALLRYELNLERMVRIGIPTLLQAGSESPSHLYATEALAHSLPQARIEVLRGQAHEGMTTAPVQYASSVSQFLLGGELAPKRPALSDLPHLTP